MENGTIVEIGTHYELTDRGENKTVFRQFEMTKLKSTVKNGTLFSRSVKVYQSLLAM